MEIDHLVFAARDLAASAAHYGRLLPVLGFRKERDHVWSNEQRVFLELRQAKDSSHGYARSGVGLNHLGVRAASRAQVDAVVAELRATGVDVPEPQIIGAAYVVFVPDPDGMRVEIGFDP